MGITLDQLEDTGLWGGASVGGLTAGILYIEASIMKTDSTQPFLETISNGYITPTKLAIASGIVIAGCLGLIIPNVISKYKQKRNSSIY